MTVKDYIEQLAEKYPPGYADLIKRDLFENWADELEQECTRYVEMARGNYLPWIALEMIFRFMVGVPIEGVQDLPEPKSPGKVLPFPDKEEKRATA